MGWTKDEVDKYVAKVERNINTPREKNLKGFAFARLYKEARDNVKAKRHLEAYLSVNESDFRGHRMMGQLFEETGNLEKALLSYRRSLDLNNTQHDLVLKVVELYCQVPVDPGRARAWADRAARLYPGHPAVFKLRMHLLESVGKIDYEQMEDLISEELAKRPRDAKLHIRLIKVYSTTGRLVEAYSHCASVIRTKAFDDDTEWWMCAVDVFEKYMAGQEKMIPSDRDIGPGHVILDSHAHLMAALSQLLNIFLKTEKTRETINLLYRLDHSLTMAHERKVRTTARGSQSQKSEWHVVLTEMRGQLYIHCATLILKLAKENYLTWPRALKLASVCYTTCVQVQEPDITTPWVARAPKNKDALRWYHMACYRLSHAGHLLEAIIHKYGEEWLDNCISDWCTQQGQDEILNTVYGEHRDKSKSFLANDEEFFLLEINLPSVEQLVKYDEVCVGNNPRNLELITWIGLHWYHYERSIRPGVGVVVARIFDGLRMDVPNIEQTAADTLCLRDLEAFVYAVIRTSAAKFLEDQDLYIPDYQPQVLPQQLCDCLTSQAQEEWWLAAYNLYAGAASVSSAGRVRATVQRGLEVIRALGVHGLHIRLLIYLAFNFGDKASYLKTAGGVNPWYYQEHWKSLQARSLHYWKEALILLEKIERNENIPVRKDPLFPLLQNSMMTVDIKLNIQKARLILGEAALREGKIEEAMEVFEQVKTIQGMWNLAQIYKYLANVEAQAAASEDLDSDAQSSSPTQEYYNCLNKARELLLACMDKVPGEERRRQTLQDELNDIEDMLNEDPNRPQANPRKQLDFRQLDFQASRSSTMSDVQESEDNFWLEQPQDASSKDLIAKLSEVTLNNGYLQEQMAVRDQHLKELNSKVQLLETELRELKLRGFSGIMSPTNYPSPAPVPSITAQHNLPPFTSPVTHGPVSFETVSTTPTTSRQQTALNGRPLESTPVARPSVKSRLGPRIPVQTTTPEPPKIDSNFFAGLSQTNSPETKSELDQSEEGETEQESVRHDSTSFDDGIHFEPIIPLPQQIEKKTGEEGEIALFNKRAKLYRYDKDLKSWKERGTGTLKILSADGETRFRILMRRDHILKICANHLITTEMELKPLKGGSQNSLVWTTAADFADETPNVEQLAVRFKLAEEAAAFKVVFESCKNKLSGAPVTTSPTRLSTAEKDRGENNTDNNAAMPSTTDTDGTALSKFLPKAGTWECSNSFVDNEEKQSSCVAGSASRPSSKDPVLTETITSSLFTQPLFQWSLSEKVKALDSSSKGAPNVSFAPQSSAFNKPSSDVSFGLPHGGVKLPSQEPEATQKFPFEFDPAPLQPEEPEEAIIKRGGMTQQPTPFSFSFKPSSSSSSSPLSFSFGKTQAPSFTLAPFGVSTTPSTSSQVTSSSTPVGFSFGPSSNETPKYERPQDKDDSKDTKPLTFTASPSNALPGFDIDNDEEQENASGDSANVSSEFSSASQQVASASSSVPSTIPPQLFWQQQLEEKFKFGNLHRTEPLAGMAPVVVAPSSGKPDATYPASFLLSKLAGKSTSAPVSSQSVQGMGDSEANVPSLQQLKEKSLAHGAATQGAQRPDLLMSLLQSKPRESSSQLQDLSNVSAVTPDDSSKTSEDLDDYSDDLETESEEESGSYHSSDDYNEDEDYSHSLEGDVNKTIVSQPSPTTHQLVPQGQSIMPKPPLMSTAPAVSGRKFLTARSPLKKVHPKEDECVIIYEIRAAKTDRDKASRLLLPLNFFNHGRTDPCPGCLGCDENVRAKMKQEALTKSEKALATPATPPKPKPEDSPIPAPKKESHIFGASLGDKPLSFASFSTTSGSSFGKKGTSHGSSAFPMAGQQLFGSPAEDEAHEADIYFKPLIPLPELIKVTTGEEDHTMLFSERARLYRFDASSSMWKERGIGDIKLLLDNKTGRGRVVMRREQVHKLCANHWITEDMELRTNSTSDRSWVWQTLADFSEETPSQEKLAVRFKQPDTALKFKDQFDDLVALARKKSAESNAAGKTSENSSEQPRDSTTSSSAVTIFETPNKDQRSEEVDGTGSLIDKFKSKQGTWECSVCMVQNNSGTTACVACNTPKSGQTSEPASVQAQKFTFGSSSQGTGFSIPTAFKFGNQPQQPDQPGGASMKPLFTIGRGDAPEEELDEETSFRHHSPSKISPSKSPSKISPSSTAPPSSGTPVKPLTGFAFGSLSHTKFNFKLELTPDKGPSVRSPQSPTSPESPGSHPEAEDDGIHFEPIIPLPKKIAKKTGEENEEVLFCHRAKLYRFDHEGNLWKERGIGDMKILRSTSSGKCRIVMRREIVLKLCTNHQVTPEMTLKPNAGSEKSWVWNTFADFADEVAKQETLAVRFKTSEVAQSFKDAFEKAKESKVQTEVSETEGEGEGKQAPLEDDSTHAQESEETSSKQSTEDQKLQKSPAVEKDEKPKDEKDKTETKKEDAQPSSFLFGSSSISSLSFASVASCIESGPGLLVSTKGSQGFKPGPALFSRSPAQRRESEESEGEESHEHDDGPHFEPLVSLPEKVDVRTGEEEEEIIFSHRAKLYRFDCHLKQWKERGVGDIKILFHKKNGRVRILMRRDHVLKICANHYVTPEMNLNPNGSSTKSWVWNTLADFSDEEVKAEQLAVRFKLEETAREFKGKFDNCKEKMIQQASEVNDQSKTTTEDNLKEDIADTEGESNKEVKEKSPENVDETDSIIDKFKLKPGAWECEACLIQNNPGTTACVACNTPKPGHKSEPAANIQALQTFSFGASPQGTNLSKPAGKSDGDEAVSSSQSTPAFGFGGLSFGLPSKDVPSQKPPFTFGSTSVPEEDTTASEPSSTHVSEDATDSATAQETKQDSLIDKFKAKPGTWDCETCLVPNDEDSTKCVACSSPKPGVDQTQAALSTQSVSAFGLGGPPKPTGFSFGLNGNSAPITFGGISFGLPSKDLQDHKPQSVLGNASEPKEDTTASEPSSTHVSEDATDSATAQDPTQAASSTQSAPAFGLGGPKPTGFSFRQNANSAPITFGGISFGLPSKDSQSQAPQSVLGNASEPKEDTTASEPSSTHVSEDATDSATAQETKQDSLIDKLKAKPGTWDCETCLVFNDADSTKCVACSSPKPGVDQTQAALSTQSDSAFGLGGPPKPTGFSFGLNGNSAPITFGGISFGLPSKDLQDHKPQSVLGNASEPKEDTVASEDTTASEPSSTHVSEDATDSVTARDPTHSASSTQSASAFGFGGPKLTGFSFGQNANSVPVTSGGFSFRLPSKDAQSQKPQSVLGNASEPKEDTFASEDTTTSEPSSTHVSEDATESATAQETKQDSLMDKFKAKPGTWDCETCLVPNDADSTKCVACSSPRPGVDTTQASLSTQSAPAFGLGGPKPTGFSFGQSTSSALVTFGGFSFGLPSKDTQSQEPQSAFGNTDIPKEGTTVSKASATSIFGGTTDISKTAGTSKVPEFTFGAPNVGQSCKDEDIEPAREAVIQPEEEDKAEAVATDATESRKPDVIDLTLTNVVEPSEEEKRRARSLLLPEGFFLYQRQPQTPSSVARAKEKSPNRVPVENKTAVQKEAKKTEEPKSVFGSSSALSFSSFSDVSIDKGFQFGGQKSSKGFAGQGTQLFSSTHGTDDGVEEERDIDFKPLVDLPEIEVVTGEEDEEKVFSHRAKLYRFESSVSQWKERGVGEIKILENKNSKKFRIVMRRDQIHKLCANHIITTDMNLVPNAGSERSWVWHTLADLSEEEPRAEQLAVRFKWPETAKEFKKVFEECKAILSEQNQGDASVSEVDSSSIETVSNNEVVKLEPAKCHVLSVTADNTTHSSDGEDKKQLLVSNSSKEKEDGTAGVGSSDDARWECRSCHVSNDSSSNTHKEYSTPREESNEGIDLQENLDTTERQETPEPDSTVSEDKDSPKPSQPEFLFGTKSLSSLSFSDAAKVGIFGQTSSSSSETFSFKGLNDQKPVEDKPEDDDQDDGYHDTSGDYIHFEPIIELPDKIETVTGEENEEVVFKHRAKLFRFDKEVKQWKERGVGEMKILTGKGQSRIVMRREHIHKLCANHLITINMTLKANNSEKSWMWQTLADVSEEEPKEELLAVRFKTAEIAQEFKTKFDECRDTSDPPDKSLSVGIPNESSGESSDKEEPSVKEEAEGVSEDASENIQEMPSSSTSPSRQDPMPSNSTQLVAGSPGISIPGAEFRSFWTVKKEVKQSSSVTTSSHRIEQSAIAKLYQEEKVFQSGDTKTEESQQVASLALQEKEITSSGEEKPFMPSFSPEARAMMQPSIFNQQLLSRQGQSGIFNQELMFRQGPGLFGRQPVFPTPSLESTSPMFSAQSLIDQPASSQSPGNVTKMGPRDLRQTETRTVEMTQQLSSSVVTSSDRKTVSCSPEITKMLEEIENEDEDKNTEK